MKSLASSLLAALLLGATAAPAQTTFRLGLRGGANRALTTTDPAGNQSGSYPFSSALDKQALTAWQAGVVLEARRGHFAVQPSLLFSQKGERQVFASSLSGVAGNTVYRVSTTNRYNWLELPVNFVYTRGGDHGWQLLAGPYLALGVGGRRQGSILSYTGVVYDATPTEFEESISYGPGTYNRRLDVGLNLGLGYRRGPVQVQLSYGLGLRNLHQDDVLRPTLYNPSYFIDRNGAAYNRVAQLTGTYFFQL